MKNKRVKSLNMAFDGGFKQKISKTTRIIAYTYSVIDLIFTNDSAMKEEIGFY